MEVLYVSINGYDRAVNNVRVIRYANIINAEHSVVHVVAVKYVNIIY